MNTGNRPFQQTTPPKKQLNLQMDNKNSMTEQLPKPPPLAQGQKQATAANAKLNGYSERAASLAISFKKALEDKTLPVNKSPIAKDVERGLINSFIELGIEMNNDPHEEKDGMGGIGIISLLLWTGFIQRDRINELEYTVEQMKIKLAKVENLSQRIDTTKTSG
jgi:hypothetical protein